MKQVLKVVLTLLALAVVSGCYVHNGPGFITIVRDYKRWHRANVPPPGTTTTEANMRKQERRDEAMPESSETPTPTPAPDDEEDA